ncbi:MAG: SPOR domain-containing protein [Bacteroidaceae bacterium]|nr:SPOR domain-containing protein [Bacteroidaceae bacterium]MBR4338803.1 SPOR domain-containing protein [Bacteroidaceae bacterium]
MKKTVFFVLMGAALMFTSCKSSQSAYRQAYEKAKAQETYTQTEANAPVQTTAASETRPVTPVTDNTPVRQEAVVDFNGEVKSYSVVCGSFSVQTNAEDLCQKLKADGYKAGIVKNVDRNMYRVYIGTYNTKAEAVTARDAFKAANPDRQDFQESWILLKK